MLYSRHTDNPRYYDPAARAWTPEGETAWREQLVDEYGDNADEELFCIPSSSSGAYLTRANLTGANITDANGTEL